MKLLYCLIFLSIMSFPDMLLAQMLVIEDDFSASYITHVQYIKDENHSFDFKTIKSATQWQKADQEIFNRGLDRNPHWLRFGVENRSSSHRHLLINIPNPIIDFIELEVIKSHSEDVKVSIGDNIPIADRLIDHGDYLIPLELKKNESAFITARVQSNATLQIPIQVTNYTAFIEQNYQGATLYGLFFGLLLAVTIYHFLIFSALKDVNFLFYALTNLSLFFIFISLRGYPAVFLFPDSPYARDVLLLLSICCTMTFSCFFTKSILVLNQTRPRFALVLDVIAYVNLVLVLIIPWVNYHALVMPVLILVGFALPANAAAHIIRFVDGYPPARYVFFAGIFTILGLNITVLEKTGLLPSNVFTTSASYVGIAIMTMLYSLAVAYRLNMDKELREQAQSDAVDAQRVLIESQKRINEKLDSIVHERTEALQEANAKLHEISNTDSLTKLRNRRFFEEACSQEFARALREGSPISVLLMDVDHFKKLNDTFGHQFGDLCLQKAGEIIQRHMKRPTDIAARYGGEEFIVLLPNTNKEGALSVAKKIHQEFASTTIREGDKIVRMTMSIGVSNAVPNEKITYEHLIKEADDLLYKAKEAGRNRVMVS